MEVKDEEDLLTLYGRLMCIELKIDTLRTINKCFII